MEYEKCQLCSKLGHIAPLCPVFLSQYKLWFVKKVWYEHLNEWSQEDEEVWPLPKEFSQFVIIHNHQKTSGWRLANRYPIDIPLEHDYFRNIVKTNSNEFYNNKLLKAKIYAISE